MAKPFYDTLKELRGGRTAEELADGLMELVAAVKAMGTGGRLTLDLILKPVGQGVEVADEVTVKLPKLRRQSSLFFTTADNQLSKIDPAQRELPFKAVPAEIDATRLRSVGTVNTETGEIKMDAEGSA